MKIKPNAKTKMKNQYETSAKQVRNEYKTKDEQNQKQTSMKHKLIHNPNFTLNFTLA